MGKRKHKRESDELYSQVLQIAAQSLSATNVEFRNNQGDRFIDEMVASIESLSSPTALSRPQELPMMKKFLF